MTQNRFRITTVAAIVLLLIILVLIMVFTLTGVVPKESFSVEGFKVVIDASHGLPDKGLVGEITGKKESNYNLYTAQVLESRLNEMGVATVMTRKDSNALSDTRQDDLALRKRIITTNAPDAAISFEVGYREDKTFEGPQVYYSPSSEKGRILAEAVQEKLNEEFKIAGRKAEFREEFITNAGDIPVIVIEYGNFSNPEDELLLRKKNYRMRVAGAVIRGLEAYAEAGN